MLISPFRYFLLLGSALFNLWCVELCAQKYVSSNNYQEMADFNELDNKPYTAEIGVSGLPDMADSNYGLEKIQLAIFHERISDIKVVLESPDGTEVWISNRHGRDGAHYLETIFTSEGFKGHIAQGVAPFLGEYMPDGQLSYFNDGQNPNGVWLIKVFDLEEGVQGKFGSVVLYFSEDPAVNEYSPCTTESPQNCKCPKDSNLLLPDLTLIPKVTKEEWHEVAYDSEKGFGELRFAASAMNIGYGPLELVGTEEWYCGKNRVNRESICDDGTYPRQPIKQIIYEHRRKKFKVTEIEAGYNAYDARPGHEHYHSDDFMEYKLFKKDATGTGMIEVANGTKASFCVWDLGYCREDLENCLDFAGIKYTKENLINFGFGQFRHCDSHHQGLSVGGIDYYGERFEGQVITLPEKVENGEYILQIELDPLNLYKEVNENNNLIHIDITLQYQE